jgi:hypothetical protein
MVQAAQVALVLAFFLRDDGRPSFRIPGEPVDAQRRDPLFSAS